MKTVTKLFAIVLVFALAIGLIPANVVQAAEVQTLYVSSWSDTTAIPFSGRPTVIFDSGTYHMWYGADATNKLYYTSAATPTGFAAGVETVFDVAPLEKTSVTIVKEGGVFYMVTYGATNKIFAIYTSSDGINWSFKGNVFDGNGIASYDSTWQKFDAPSLLVDGSKIKLYFQVKPTDGISYVIFMAESDVTTLADMANGNDDNDFTLANSNQPVLTKGAVGDSDETRVMHPNVVKVGSMYFMSYVGVKPAAYFTNNVAFSTDGITWTKGRGNPVLASTAGDYAEPSVVVVDGTWNLWYMFGGGPIKHVSTKGPFEFSSIQLAHDKANAGDTVIVADGTYTVATEPVADVGLVNIYKQITIKAAADGNDVRPVIDATGRDGVFKIHANTLSDGQVVIEGFDITGDKATTGKAITTMFCGGAPATKIIIRENLIHGMLGGFEAWGSSSFCPAGTDYKIYGIEITDNDFYDLGVTGIERGFGVVLQTLSDWTEAGNAYAALVSGNSFSNIYTKSTTLTDLGVGIAFLGGSANASVFENSFSGDISVDIAMQGADVSTTDIHNNDLSAGVYGVAAVSTTGGSVDAAPNWWGQATGPASAQLMGLVDYVPWCLDATCTTFGYPPVHNVTLDRYYATIQAAVVDLTAEPIPTEMTTYTITVAEGTYQVGTTIDILQQANKNIVLQPETGADVTIKDQIRINGNGRSSGIESLTIQGFAFDLTDTTYTDAITTYAVTGITYNYSHNVYIKNSTFTGDSSLLDVAVRAGAGGGHYNYVLENLTATSMHSLGQFTSVSSVTVKDCTVSGGKSGVNLTGSPALVENLTYSGNSYGIRTDLNLTIKNSSLISSGDANDLTDPDTALVLRNNTVKTITIENSLLKNTVAGNFAISNNVNSPTEKVTLIITSVDTGGGSFDTDLLGGFGPVMLVHDIDVDTKQYQFFNTIQAAIDAATAGDVITVAAGTYPEQVNVTKAITLRGPNTGIDPNEGMRVAEAIIAPVGTGTVGVTVQPEVGAVILEGFTVQGYTDWGFRQRYTATGVETPVHVLNNIFDPLANTYWYAVEVNSDGSTVLNNLIKAGTSTDASNSIGIVTYDSSNLQIKDNVVGGTPLISGGIVVSDYKQAGVSDVIISGNTINNTEEAIMLYGIEWEEPVGSGTWLHDGSISNVTIDHNIINVANEAIQAFSLDLLTNLTVEYNQFNDVHTTWGTVVDINLTDVVTGLDLSPNWWDKVSGPVPGTDWDHHYDIYVNAGSVASALYTPWCGEPGCTTLINPPVHNITQDRLYLTIQAAIDDPSTVAGDVIEVAAGTYVENVVVDKSVEIYGAGATTFIMPAVSNPICTPGSLCGGLASNVILVAASDVKIHDLTVDGDNPALTSGIVRGGADLDARNGIIKNGTFNNLEVYNTSVKNIYLRGIYSTGGSFNFHDNTVTNVQGEYASIAMFAWGGPGIFEDNVVSYANDGISANHSNGIQWLNNTVTMSGSGIHTDNSGDGGGVADVIRGNTVSDCLGGDYGIWTFVNYLPVMVENNNVTDCALPYSAWGSANTTTVQFNNNTATAPSPNAGSVGIYVTTSGAGWGYYNTNANFTGNTLTGFDYGIYLGAEETSWDPDPYVAKTITSTISRNNITGSTSMAVYQGPTGGYNVHLEENWWGSILGPQAPISDGLDVIQWCGTANPTCLPLMPQSGSTLTLSGDLVLGDGNGIYVPGLTIRLADGTTIAPTSGACFDVNADFTTIEAATNLGAVCVPASGENGINVADGLLNVVIKGLEFDGSAGGVDGIHFNGITDLMIVDNWFHNLTGDAIEFTEQPAGVVSIQGNLFQANGGLGINASTFAVPAEYNSWGHVDGAVAGDGKSANVDADPYTHVDLYITASGVAPVGGTVTIAVYGNLENVYGTTFSFKYPDTLSLVGNPTNLSAFVPSNGTSVFTVDSVTRTITFDGYMGTTLAGPNPPISGEALPLFSATFDVLGAGGVLDLIDTNDKFIMMNDVNGGPSTNIYALALVDGQLVDLSYTVKGTVSMQGRSVKNGVPVVLTGVGIYGPYGTTSINALSDNYTITAVAGGEYTFSTNQPRYLNVTSGTFGISPKVNVDSNITLPSLVLKGGNANWANNRIDAGDASMIGTYYGQIINNDADVNFDGKVDITDLTLVGGNFLLTSANAYGSWLTP